jgi:hypothetical protein
MMHLTSAIIGSSYMNINEKLLRVQKTSRKGRFNDHHIFNNIICLELNADDTFYLHCIQLLQSRALENMIYGIVLWLCILKWTERDEGFVWYDGSKVLLKRTTLIVKVAQC